MKRIFTLTLVGFLLASCNPLRSVQYAERSTQNASSSSAPLGSNSASSLSSSNALRPNPNPSPDPLPFSVTLAVPFSPQAPSANWDAQHEEACEEMSLILVHHFLEGTGITQEQAEVELQALIQWEEEHGYPQDVTVAQLKEVAERYYGHTGRVIENPTTEVLKRLLAEHKPVIIPAAGRDLGNPYFSGEGPWYHMLILTGYREFFFITNDVGTRRGEGYVYGFQTLMDAIHDWTGVKEEIRRGAPRVLVIESEK